MTEITQHIVVQARADDLFARADELFAMLLQEDPGDGGFSLTIHKTSPGPLGLGTTFRASARAMGLSLGADLRCTEYVPPRHVTVQSMNGLPLQAMLAFEPQGDGTMVTARLRYESPAGLMGAMFEALAPPDKIEKTMRRGLERVQQHLVTAEGHHITTPGAWPVET